MNEYLLKIKGVIDTLAAVGNPIPVHDYIEVLIDGLPNEYESVVTTVLSKTENYSVDEIEALLLAQESRLEKKLQLHILDANKTDAPSNMTANMAQTKSIEGRGSNINCGRASAAVISIEEEEGEEMACTFKVRIFKTPQALPNSR